MLANIFSTNEKPVLVIQKLLRLLKVPVTDTTVSDTLQNHPDYPSLLSLHDALHSWNIDTRAIKIEKADLDLYPLPFIADCYTKEGEEYLLVTEVNENEVHYFLDKDKPTVISKDEFITIGSGACLFVNASHISGEKDYAQNKKKEAHKALRIPISFMFLGLIAILAIMSFSRGVTTISTISSYAILLILKVTGVFITGLLLWYEIDKANPTLQKICTAAGTKTNCSAILSSKQSKLFSVASWSEIGFFYFCSGLLTLLAASLLEKNASSYLLSLVVLLNLTAVPYIFFSIYYQWRIAKQWCVLCLSVQTILGLEFITTIGTGTLQKATSTLSVSVYILIPILSVIVCATGWYFLKPLFLKNETAKRTQRELLRLKFNTEIFEALLSKQKRIEYSTEGLGITIGNSNATNTIVKVCNPYCGPCAKAHLELEKILERNSDIKVQIIFNASNESNDLRTPPVKLLMAIAENGNQETIKQALDDWYGSDDKDYETFSKKYPMNGELNKQVAKINAMHKWYKDIKIGFTPTIFINGNQLPDVYELKDLNYFLQ